MKVITSFLSVIILALLLNLNASAQNAESYTGSLLWKVSGNGLDKPSYILGTHHLVHVNFVDSIAGLKDVMENAEQTVGELVMSDQAAMQTKIQQSAMMPAGETYHTLLSPEDYTKLDAGVSNVVGAGLAQLGSLKPGMISMLYTITLYTKIYPGFNPMSHEAIDAYVQRIAKEKEKPVLGLESVEDQIYALFDATPLKEQAEALVCAVGQQDDAKEQLDELNRLYHKGDLMGMYNFSFNNPDDECQASQEQQDALLKDRNNKWMEKLPAILKDKSNLIAVGALHLAGEEGILYQLAKLGYKVEPVKK
ncbi:hypothetical protein GGR21_000554 [Dysgonomonas hofstadii]|uniref:TraB/GumN family protein n=1 Tax=Dysgonomonas hofstadii TaxID=637886 RepID=A0A840CF90_9BACT|nr:TraB/GumN family protein [Dysgonomonas hofstadii]MBB4034667.1 hypothetical protein [Dysgonomonas hofstadii]